MFFNDRSGVVLCRHLTNEEHANSGNPPGREYEGLGLFMRIICYRAMYRRADGAQVCKLKYSSGQRNLATTIGWAHSVVADTWCRPAEVDIGRKKSRSEND